MVFARPRHGVGAILAQLGAWALQWLACYMVVLALGLQSQATLVTAAAVLLAVNVSAVLPATPSNVGVFQAACLVVLAAYGVGAGAGLAYGIILQAVEVTHRPAAGRSGPARRGAALAGHPRLGSQRHRRRRVRDGGRAGRARVSRRRRLRPAGRSQPTRARSDWRSEWVVCSTAVGS